MGYVKNMSNKIGECLNILDKLEKININISFDKNGCPIFSEKYSIKGKILDVFGRKIFLLNGIFIFQRFFWIKTHLYIKIII
jgi:hypothetical protein